MFLQSNYKKNGGRYRAMSFDFPWKFVHTFVAHPIGELTKLIFASNLEASWGLCFLDQRTKECECDRSILRFDFPRKFVHKFVG